MASFLPVIVSRKDKQNKEKYAFYHSVPQIHINLEKNTKNRQNDFLGCTYWLKMRIRIFLKA